MTYYIRAEDFAVAYVGPFTTEAEAQEHISFCTARGDSGLMVIVDAVGADAHFTQTAEQDRGFKVSHHPA
jgi:hypothetical protein